MTVLSQYPKIIFIAHHDEKLIKIIYILRTATIVPYTYWLQNLVTKFWKWTEYLSNDGSRAAAKICRVSFDDTRIQSPLGEDSSLRRFAIKAEFRVSIFFRAVRTWKRLHQKIKTRSRIHSRIRSNSSTVFYPISKDFLIHPNYAPVPLLLQSSLWCCSCPRWVI